MPMATLLGSGNSDNRVRNLALRDFLYNMYRVYNRITTVNVSETLPFYRDYCGDRDLLLGLYRMPSSLKIQKLEEMGFSLDFLQRIVNFWRNYSIEGTEEFHGEELATAPANALLNGGGPVCQLCGHVAANLEALACHIGSIHMAGSIVERFAESRQSNRVSRFEPAEH